MKPNCQVSKKQSTLITAHAVETKEGANELMIRSAETQMGNKDPVICGQHIKHVNLLQ